MLYSPWLRSHIYTYIYIYIYIYIHIHMPDRTRTCYHVLPCHKTHWTETVSMSTARLYWTFFFFLLTWMEGMIRIIELICMITHRIFISGNDWPIAISACIKSVRPCNGCMCWHIEAETKWPPLSIRHFQMHFLNENMWILIMISLNFVPEGPINSIPGLVQIMAWRRTGDKPLSETIMVISPTHICVTQPQCVNGLCHRGFT